MLGGRRHQAMRVQTGKRLAPACAAPLPVSCVGSTAVERIWLLTGGSWSARAPPEFPRPDSHHHAPLRLYRTTRPAAALAGDAMPMATRCAPHRPPPPAPSRLHHPRRPPAARGGRRAQQARPPPAPARPTEAWPLDGRTGGGAAATAAVAPVRASIATATADTITTTIATPPSVRHRTPLPRRKGGHPHHRDGRLECLPSQRDEPPKTSNVPPQRHRPRVAVVARCGRAARRRRHRAGGLGRHHLCAKRCRGRQPCLGGLPTRKSGWQWLLVQRPLLSV